MDSITVPYKISTMIETYEGDWTAEQIDAGLAGEPRLDVHEEWCENTPEGRRTIVDPQRIAELEARIKEKS